MLGMRRRKFITLLGGAAAWPLAARAQQAMPVIGFLDPGTFEANALGVVRFRQGLAEAGFVEGRNVAIEFRWANTQTGRLRALADDLVGRRVAVIVATGAVVSALAAKAATATIPIVIATGSDPVKYGLVASLARPGGNITGVTYLANELEGKRLDLLRELVPSAKFFAYLVGNQQSKTSQEQTSELLAAAGALGRQVIVLECRSDRDFEVAFATLVERHAEALIVGLFPLAFNNRDKIVALAARHKIPAVYPFAAFAYDGGLVSYSAGGVARQVAFDYVGRILKGAKPADLPVQRPTKFELIINLKTANVLGLEIPPTLLTRADEVIE
jgi:putative ABC transport system substrate-binding protein